MTDRWPTDPPQVLTVDPFDFQVEQTTERASRPVARSAFSHWLGMRWSGTSVPVALILVLGIGLGPYGVNLLSRPVLEFLDPAMPVTLAVLGVLLGLAVGVRHRDDRRRVAMACAASVLTVAVVAIGMALTSTAVAAAATPRWMLGLLAGVCAAISLGMPTGYPSVPNTPSARVMEFEAALLIVIGGLWLAFLRERALLSTVSLAAQSCAVALVLATAGRLLLRQPSSDTEQRVITLATLMLVGGVSDYLSLSPLLAGLVAGTFWQVAGGPAREWMRRDALYVLHPLVVVLLLAVGARVEPSPVTLGLAGIYVLLRCVGEITGGSLMRRLGGRGAPQAFDQALFGPGVFGVALAFDALRAVGSDLSVLVTVIVVGTIGSHVLAAVIDRPEAVE